MTTPTPADYEGAHSTGSTTAPAEATRADAPPTGKADDTVVAASPAAAAAGSPEETYQIAYLLLQLQEAPGGRLAKGKANRFPRAVQRELNLSADAANALRERLVEEGYVRSGRKAGSLTYESACHCFRLIVSARITDCGDYGYSVTLDLGRSGTGTPSGSAGR